MDGTGGRRGAGHVHGVGHTPVRRTKCPCHPPTAQHYLVELMGKRKTECEKHSRSDVASIPAGLNFSTSKIRNENMLCRRPRIAVHIPSIPGPADIPTLPFFSCEIGFLRLHRADSRQLT